MSADPSTTNTAAQSCLYPQCNCPFDAPADPNWCARGLPRATLTQQQGGEQGVGSGETDLEIVQQFVRTCREMKPVGQWPGERLCAAIERMARKAETESDDHSRTIGERDHMHDIIDKLCDAVLGPDRHEWSSAYFFEDAVAEVEDELAALRSKQAAGEAVLRQAIERARVFDDGSDGADAESARSVVALLTSLLATPPRHPADEARDAARYRGIKQLIAENRQDCIAPIPEVQNAETFEVWVDATIANYNANPERPA